jgi:hypothetical protein
MNLDDPSRSKVMPWQRNAEKPSRLASLRVIFQQSERSTFAEDIGEKQQAGQLLRCNRSQAGRRAPGADTEAAAVGLNETAGCGDMGKFRCTQIREREGALSHRVSRSRR